MNPLIRPGRLSDLPEILELVRRVVRSMQADGIDQWDDQYPDAATLTDDLSKGNLFVAESDSAVRGIVVLNEEQDREYDAVPWTYAAGPVLVVHRLAIDPSVRRSGIARRFMLFAESVARAHGYAAIRLDTFTGNAPALTLYDRLGYRRAGIVTFRKGEFQCFERKINA